MIRRFAFTSLVALMTVGAAMAAPPGSEENTDPDWPCTQQLVPEIAAAQVWTAEVPDPAIAMTAPPDLSELGRQSMSPVLTDAKAIALLNDYFGKIKDRKRIAKEAPIVFAVALNEANVQRARQISGIKSFNRGQMALSKKLADDVNELDKMTGGVHAKDGTPEKAVEDRAHMEQRVFEDREHQVRYLCEAPATGEQRIGAVAKTLQDFMAKKAGK